MAVKDFSNVNMNNLRAAQYANKFAEIMQARRDRDLALQDEARKLKERREDLTTAHERGLATRGWIKADNLTEEEKARAEAESWDYTESGGVRYYQVKPEEMVEIHKIQDGVPVKHKVRRSRLPDFVGEGKEWKLGTTTGTTGKAPKSPQELYARLADKKARGEKLTPTEEEELTFLKKGLSTVRGKTDKTGRSEQKTVDNAISKSFKGNPEAIDVATKTSKNVKKALGEDATPQEVLNATGVAMQKLQGANFSKPLIGKEQGESRTRTQAADVLATGVDEDAVFQKIRKDWGSDKAKEIVGKAKADIELYKSAVKANPDIEKAVKFDDAFNPPARFGATSWLGKIVNTVEGLKRLGVSKDVADVILRQKGWELDDIAEVQKRFKAPEKAPAPAPKPKDVSKPDAFLDKLKQY